MNKKLKVFAFGLMFSLVFFHNKVLAANYLSENTPKVSIDTNKEWTVKFSIPLNKETINNTNIVVKDEKNNPIPAIVSMGDNSSTIVISPRVSGYEPNKSYNLWVSENVESITGRKLNKSINMQFKTVNKYSDGTSYSDLPQVTSVKYDYEPLLSSQKQGFNIITKGGDNVQYRVFVHSYTDPAEVYKELTNGYTASSNGKITSLKTLTSSLNGKYKVIIYAKRADVVGAHKDANTDYDNYYVDYFRVLDSISTSNNATKSYDISLDEMVNIQKNLDSTPVFVEYSDMTNQATKNQLKYYLNPNNFMDDYGKYQFLKLSYTEGITAEDLNGILKGKGILEGKGQAYLDAAKQNNINVAYLVSHSLLETGNGSSLLANGGLKDSEGNYVNEGQPVYNFFGIGAIDTDADFYGTKTAFENKWFTPEEAIMGGAQWISSRYINNPNGAQDTLYKMRWNPEKPGAHQYATDISWSYKQIRTLKKQMDDITSQVKNVVLIFEIPKFK